jgi:hypothetical protein
MYWHQSSRHVLAYLSLIVMAIALLGSRPAQAERAGATTVGTFYATTLQADKAWPKTHYAAPPKSSVFPDGTSTVAFYFTYAGAGKSSGFYVVIRTHQGPTVTVTGWWKIAAGSSSDMVYVPYPGGNFPNGAYDADLVVDSYRLATIAFTVGAGGGDSGGDNSSSATISNFQTSTAAAVNGWAKQKGLQPLPAATTQLPAGINEVWFVFVYKGVTPKVTTEQVVVQGPNGLRLTDTAKPFALPQASGGIYTGVVAPEHLAFPNGSYSGALLINGQQAAQTAFTIG